jgi:hypothetical protein
MPQLMADKGY